MIRHYTASGYVIYQGRVLLHWHLKVKALLPPGGHIDPGEDPVQTVLREIKEETGLTAQILSPRLPFAFDYPRQVPPPVTIMVEDILDPDTGPHQHIDMIYFCRLMGDSEHLKEGWYWISEADIAHRVPVTQTDGSTALPPEDVLALALEAFRILREAGL